MFGCVDFGCPVPYGTVMPREAGIQISLRLPPATLAKLTRLAELSVQTKSQYVTKLLERIPTKYLEKPSRKIPSKVLSEALQTE
jgi:hypothetical protein